MTTSVTIRNIFCEVTVRATTLDADERWQPLEMEFWQRLFSQAPTALLQRYYGSRLQVEQTRQDAINILRVRLDQHLR